LNSFCAVEDVSLLSAAYVAEDLFSPPDSDYPDKRTKLENSYVQITGSPQEVRTTQSSERPIECTLSSGRKFPFSPDTARSDLI
jgi:hypothetical protein